LARRETCAGSLNYPTTPRSSWHGCLAACGTASSALLNEFEEKDDSQWSNIKALQGPEWKGRLRKRVGPYRIIFRKDPDRGTVEISAILVKSKGTYR